MLIWPVPQQSLSFEKAIIMIKGLSITPPVIGRISIGKVVEKNGKRLPEKDDYFTITTQVQNKEGWVLHPLHQKLLDQSPAGKIRSIPIKLLFNDPELNFRSEYALFDRNTGRPLCVGNGDTARGLGPEGMQTLPCPTPDGCEGGRKGGCKPYGRLNVQIKDQNDDLGTFILRTTGYNSIRTLTAKLAYFHALSQGNSSHLPLALKIRGKSTSQSHRAPIFYVDICLREGISLGEAIHQARQEAQGAMEAGFDLTRLEQAAREGISNGLYEDSAEEVPAIVEEFFSEEAPPRPAEPDIPPPETAPSPLAGKLKSRAIREGH